MCLSTAQLRTDKRRFMDTCLINLIQTPCYYRQFPHSQPTHFLKKLPARHAVNADTFSSPSGVRTNGG